MTRNIRIDKGVRRNQHIVADRDSADNGRIDADLNLVSEDGRTRFFPELAPTVEPFIRFTFFPSFAKGETVMLYG